MALTCRCLSRNIKLHCPSIDKGREIVVQHPDCKRCRCRCNDAFQIVKHPFFCLPRKEILPAAFGAYQQRVLQPAPSPDDQKVFCTDLEMFCSVCVRAEKNPCLSSLQERRHEALLDIPRRRNDRAVRVRRVMARNDDNSHGTVLVQLPESLLIPRELFRLFVYRQHTEVGIQKKHGKRTYPAHIPGLGGVGEALLKIGLAALREKHEFVVP